MVLPVCPAFPLLPVGAVGGGQVGRGARVFRPLAVHSCCQADSHGWLAGRCSRVRRADRAVRQGTLISWLRMVAVVALVWNVEARVPAARVRLGRDRCQHPPGAVGGERPIGGAETPRLIWS